MAVRDPETGQFVAGGAGGRKTAYSELDVQHIEATLHDPDGGHTDQLEVFESALSFEPLGGLAREELAEVVAAEFLFTHQMTGNGAHAMEGFAEVSFESTEQTLNIEADDVTETDVITGVDARNLDFVDIDILYKAQGYANSAINDTTNGSGRGAATVLDRSRQFYRAWFGEGPVTDRHDELHVHLATNDVIGNGPFRLSVVGTLWYDVFERS